MLNENKQQAKEHSRCMLCGSSESELLYHGNIDGVRETRFSQYAFFDDIFRCASCSLVFQRIRHSPEEIAGLVKSEKYLDEEIGNLNLAEKHFQFRFLRDLMQHYVALKGCSILDAGANTGVFLNYIKDETQNISGVEPSVEAVNIALKQFGIKIQQSLISEAILEDDYFDVITMFDVIEHLYNPDEDLKFLFNKIKPGGRIFITTHDIDTKLAKLAGRHYPMLMYQHFFHFSPKTLKLLLEKAGFKVLEISRFSKSWSFEYLFHLAKKLWPGTFGSLVQMVLSPLMFFKSIKRARVTVPVREFIFLAAEKLDR